MGHASLLLTPPFFLPTKKKALILIARLVTFDLFSIKVFSAFAPQTLPGFCFWRDASTVVCTTVLDYRFAWLGFWEGDVAANQKASSSVLVRSSGGSAYVALSTWMGAACVRVEVDTTYM